MAYSSGLPRRIYVLVPRGTAHAIEAAPGGGAFLTQIVPGGLEKMFFELGGLPPDAIRDPAVCAAISARYDSVPVELPVEPPR